MLNPRKVEVKTLKSEGFFSAHPLGPRFFFSTTFQIANATMERRSNNNIATSQRKAEAAALIAAFQSERGKWMFVLALETETSTETNFVKNFRNFKLWNSMKLVKHLWKHWWKVTWVEICVALVDSLHPQPSYQLASVVLKHEVKSNKFPLSSCSRRASTACWSYPSRVLKQLAIHHLGMHWWRHWNLSGLVKPAASTASMLILTHVFRSRKLHPSYWFDHDAPYGTSNAKLLAIHCMQHMHWWRRCGKWYRSSPFKQSTWGTLRSQQGVDF